MTESDQTEFEISSSICSDSYHSFFSLGGESLELGMIFVVSIHRLRRKSYISEKVDFFLLITTKTVITTVQYSTIGLKPGQYSLKVSEISLLRLTRKVRD